MMPKKGFVVGEGEEGSRDGKEEEEKKETKKKGSNVTGYKFNNENEEEKKGERGARSKNMKTEALEDDDNEEEEEEDQEEDQELPEGEDNLENVIRGIPYELNRRVTMTFLWLLKKNEDLEKKDEELISRLHKLEEERKRIVRNGYQYSFTRWTERKYDGWVEGNERRREEPKEQNIEEEEGENIRKKLKKSREERKCLQERLMGEKQLMQRGANEGSKETTWEESERKVMMQEEGERAEGKRKQMEETDLPAEKEGKKLKKPESLDREVNEEMLMKEEEEEEDGDIRGIKQERKTKELKKENNIEGKSLQRGVGKEAEVEEKEIKLKGEKVKFPKLEIRKEEERMTRPGPEERKLQPPALEGKGGENPEQEVIQWRAVQEVGPEATPEASWRHRHEAVYGGVLAGGVRRLGQEGARQQAPRKVVQPAPRGGATPLAAAQQTPRLRSVIVGPTATGRAGREPSPPSTARANRRVFVARLPSGTTPQQLRVAMGGFGAVAAVNRPRYRRGFAFVSFKKEGDMQAALQARTVRLPGGDAIIQPCLHPKERRPRRLPRGHTRGAERRR